MTVWKPFLALALISVATAGPLEDGEAAYQSGDLKGIVDNAPAVPLNIPRAVVTRRHHYLEVEWRRLSMSAWIASQGRNV